MTIEPITTEHKRLAFSCGDEKLDRYIHEHARQAKQKGLACTFVATEPERDPSEILGYYSLSSFVIQGLDIPEVVRKARNLPRHSVGATLLGRLGVAKAYQQQGIGTLLLADALKRAFGVSADVGSVAVVADAITPEGAAWYRRFGFIPASNDDLRLILMMDTIAQLQPGVPATEGPEQTVLWSA